MTKKKSAPAQAGTEGKEGSAAVPQKAVQAAKPAGAARRRGKSPSGEGHSPSAKAAAPESSAPAASEPGVKPEVQAAPGAAAGPAPAASPVPVQAAPAPAA
ncbi:MAG: hypothetical protein SPL69_10835, partial [Succinivibrionaceae bacterium]|nr:hypothetical protein [Succinivibrionaceae bacterium]